MNRRFNERKRNSRRLMREFEYHEGVADEQLIPSRLISEALTQNATLKPRSQ